MVSRRPRLSHQWPRASTVYWPPHPSAYSSDSDRRQHRGARAVNHPRRFLGVSGSSPPDSSCDSRSSGGATGVGLGFGLPNTVVRWARRHSSGHRLAVSRARHAAARGWLAAAHRRRDRRSRCVGSRLGSAALSRPHSPLCVRCRRRQRRSLSIGSSRARTRAYPWPTGSKRELAVERLSCWCLPYSERRSSRGRVGRCRSRFSRGNRTVPHSTPVSLTFHRPFPTILENTVRILMIAPEPFFEPRGTPFSEYHRIRALIDLGHTVDLVTYPFGRDVAMPGLRRVPVPAAAAHPRHRHRAVVREDPARPRAHVHRDPPRDVAERYDAVHSHEEGGRIGVAAGRAAGRAASLRHALEPAAAAHEFRVQPLARSSSGSSRGWNGSWSAARSVVIVICPHLEETGPRHRAVSARRC